MSKPYKRLLGKSVLEAARDRLAWTFSTFEKVCISFSGGKDSTVAFHLAADEARRRGMKMDVLFVDWEAQYKLTIQHIEDCIRLHSDVIDKTYWVCLPLLTDNATSMYEPEWICWEKGKEELWVREIPEQAIKDYDYFPFYTYGMTFEEFVPAFADWYSSDKESAFIVAIRCGESLNRWRTICQSNKVCKDGKRYTTKVGDTCYNVYPIYDWKTEDDWVYFSQSKNPYPPLYNYLYQAGQTIHQMRVDEPFGDTTRRGLWMYQVIEPETWGRMVSRVAGANSGSLYCLESGNISGNGKITKPDKHTWESFAQLLLDSMPEKTAEHYKNKISVWMKWYKDRGQEIQDEIEGDTGAKDKPSWKRVCRVLLRNDYWCKALCFSPTKASAYERYQNLCKRRRSEWNLI